jgi:hypothetical protein
LSNKVVVRQPKDVVAARKRSLPDLWAAIEAASPEIAAATGMQFAEVGNTPKLDGYPGLRMWLLTEFALNTPMRLIKDKLGTIREDQIAAGIEKPWPSVSHTNLLAQRRDMLPEWSVIRHRLQSDIEQVGVINKQARLMEYQSIAEELHERMWDERNDKTGELYLHRDYMAVLKAVAEEMGDLGAPAAEERDALLEIAHALIAKVGVQGSGVIATETDGKVFDYEDGEWKTVE